MPLNDPIPTDPQDAIESLIRGPPVSVAENVTLRAVAAVLSSADIGAALVRSDAGSIRMISERDVTQRSTTTWIPTECGPPTWPARAWSPPTSETGSFRLLSACSKRTSATSPLNETAKSSVWSPHETSSPS
jgi:hypothetical protein